MYEDRKLTEILWAGTLFDEFDYDTEGLSWIHIHRLALPAHLWNKRTTELLIRIPDAYPETPPYHFYLDRDLQDNRGRTPDHYFRSNEYSDKGWAWLCFHLENGWTPRKNIEDGDNLVTVIERIQVGLSGRNLL